MLQMWLGDEGWLPVHQDPDVRGQLANRVTIFKEGRFTSYQRRDMLKPMGLLVGPSKWCYGSSCFPTILKCIESTLGITLYFDRVSDSMNQP